MPMYEYRCEGCGWRVSVRVRRMGREAESCPRCGSARLTRLVSRFVLARGEEARLDRMADDAALAGVDERDPKGAAQWMRRMGQELGEEGGPELEQAVEEMERGGLEGGDVDPRATNSAPEMS